MAYTYTGERDIRERERKERRLRVTGQKEKELGPQKRVSLSSSNDNLAITEPTLSPSNSLQFLCCGVISVTVLH